MIGIDLVKIARIESMMTRFGTKALARFLSKDEMALVRTPQTAAGFWAAKEAASKAIKTGISKECTFFDITIGKLANGAPTLHYSKKVQEKFGIKASDVSITHDSGFAIAVVALQV